MSYASKNRRRGRSQKSPASKDWMPKDEELLIRASRWAEIFKRYDVDDSEECILESVSEEEHNIDNEASDELVSDSSFEDKNYKSDSDSHYEKILKETLKVVEHREVNWRKSGIDKLMDSLSIEKYGHKVYNWLKENDEFFQRDKSKYKYAENRTFPNFFSSEDSDDSVNTARYILSNRKRQITRVQTMTIKQYTISKARLMDKLKPSSVYDNSDCVFSNTGVRWTKIRKCKQVQSEADYNMRNFSRSRKFNTPSLPDNFHRSATEKRERLAPKRHFHSNISSDSSSSSSRGCKANRRMPNHKKKAKSSSRLSTSSDSLSFTDRPTRKNKGKENRVIDIIEKDYLKDAIDLLNTRKNKNSSRGSSGNHSHPSKNHQNDAKRSSRLLRSSDSHNFTDRPIRMNKGKENKVIDTADSLQDPIDLLYAKRIGKDGGKDSGNEKNQKSISVSKSLRNFDNERRSMQKGAKSNSYSANNRNGKSRNEQNNSLDSDIEMQSFDSARSFNSNDVVNSTTLSTEMKKMRIRKEKPMTTINEVIACSDSELDSCRENNKVTKNATVNQSKQGTPASPILIYSNESSHCVSGYCRDDGKVVITQNDIEKSFPSLGKELKSSFQLIVDSNATVFMCLPEEIDTSIPIDPVDLVGKRAKFKILHPTCN